MMDRLPVGGAARPGRPGLTLGALACLVFTHCASAGFRCPARGGPPWRELTSENFVLRTDLGPLGARAIARDLEVTRARLLRAMFDRPVATPERLEVFAFASNQEFLEFSTVRGALGFFSTDTIGRRRIVLPGRLISSDQALQQEVVAHEMAHYLSRHAVGRQPRWFAEGLATYFEGLGTARPGQPLAVGAAPSPAIVALGAGHLPVRDLLEWRRPTAREPDYYASSWLLVHFLFQEEPARFRAFQRRLAASEDPAAAWSAVFPEWSPDAGRAGSPATAALDEALDAHLRKGMRAALLPPVDAPVEVVERELSPAEVHALRIELRPAEGHEISEEELDEALQEEPGHVQASALRASRAPGRALALAKRAVAAHPGDPRAWELLATALPGLAAAAEREEALRRAVELAPDRPEALLGLAQDLSLSGRTEEALAVVRRFARRAPWSPQGALVEASLLADAGRCEEAGSTYWRGYDLIGDGATTEDRDQLTNEIYDAQQRCPIAGARRADRLTRQARAEPDDLVAIGLLEQAVATDPRHPEGWFELGRAYSRVGRYTEAARMFQRQLEVAPDHRTVGDALASLHLELGQPVEAELVLRRLTDRHPDDSRGYVSLGDALLRQGNDREALAAMERARALAPDDADVHLGVGRALLALGDRDAGLEALERAVKLGGDGVENDAAFELADAGSLLERAESWAGAALAREGARLRATPLAEAGADEAAHTRVLAAAWDTLGWIRFHQGRIEEAARYVAASERLLPTAEISDHLGQILEAAGRMEEAAAAYARALVQPGAPATSEPRLAALAGGDQVAARLAAARAEMERLAAVGPVSPAGGAAGQPEILLVLGDGGVVAEVQPLHAGRLPPEAAALRGLPHGIAFPDAGTDKLVVRTRLRCDDQACRARREGMPLAVEPAGRSVADSREPKPSS